MKNINIINGFISNEPSDFAEGAHDYPEMRVKALVAVIIYLRIMSR